MGIEKPPEFTPEQQIKFFEMRAEYEAQAQIQEINEEILGIKLNDGIDMIKADPMAKGEIEREKRVVSYSFNSSTSLDLDEKDQRKNFEQMFNPSLQGPLRNVNEDEETRLKRSFVRRDVLKSLGFGEPPRVFANWREGKVGKEVTFRIAQSPKDSSLFLVQTIIYGNRRFINEDLLSETILYAPDPNPDKSFDKAMAYWRKDLMTRGISPALTH